MRDRGESVVDWGRGTKGWGPGEWGVNGVRTENYKVVSGYSAAAVFAIFLLIQDSCQSD